MRIIKKEELIFSLKELFGKAQNRVIIVSAWIRGSVLKELLSLLKKDIDLEVIIRAGSLSDLEVTDTIFFRETQNFGGKIYLHPKLHSKFLIIDDRFAVLGSSNITFMGLYPEGNVETNVLIEEKEKIKELEKLYEELKKESVDYTDVVGFVLSSQNAKEAEAILLEDLKEQTFLKIPINGSFFLARLSRIQRGIESDNNILKRILSSDVQDWEIASLFAYFQENAEILNGKLEILGEYEEEKKLFKTPAVPPKVGLLIKKIRDENESLKKILLKNHSGYDMRLPVEIGKLYGTGVKTYLDLDKVIPMHMAILGTTGSGKTTFSKKLLKNLHEDVEVFLFDIYGEYGEDLRNVHPFKEVVIKNVLFPLSIEEVKELLKEGGATLEERSSEEKEFFAVIRKAIKPDIERTQLSQKPLIELLEEAGKHLIAKVFRDELNEAIEHLRRTYGEDSLSSQPHVIKEVKEVLESQERVKIFNFKNVDITETKVNLIGLILKEVFIKAKNNPKDRLIVIEEAQNVAPERGFGEVPSGRENIAYTYTKKIAMEGRKLRLGLIAITQRPANISKFILSQLNTQVIFKLITKNDLEAVSVFFEHSKEDIFKLLPFLKPGTAFISGLAVPFSFLFQMEEIPYY